MAQPTTTGALALRLAAPRVRSPMLVIVEQISAAPIVTCVKRLISGAIPRLRRPLCCRHARLSFFRRPAWALRLLYFILWVYLFQITTDHSARSLDSSPTIGLPTIRSYRLPGIEIARDPSDASIASLCGDKASLRGVRHLGHLHLPGQVGE